MYRSLFSIQTYHERVVTLTFYQLQSKNIVLKYVNISQAPHFHMCYDAGRAAGWHKRPVEAGGDVRLDHIGFGVVCGEDGKRFRTRYIHTYIRRYT